MRLKILLLTNFIICTFHSSLEDKSTEFETPRTNSAFATEHYSPGRVKTRSNKKELCFSKKNKRVLEKSNEFLDLVATTLDKLKFLHRGVVLNPFEGYRTELGRLTNDQQELELLQKELVEMITFFKDQEIRYGKIQTRFFVIKKLKTSYNHDLQPFEVVDEELKQSKEDIIKLLTEIREKVNINKQKVLSLEEYAEQLESFLETEKENSNIYTVACQLDQLKEEKLVESSVEQEPSMVQRVNKTYDKFYVLEILIFINLFLIVFLLWHWLF